MRNSLKILAVAALLLTGGIAKGQGPKFGHIDFQALIQLMPEKSTYETTLNKEAKGLEDMLTNMQNELQTKFKEYQVKRDSLSEIVRTAKEQELNDMNQKVQNFQQVAQQQLQQKQNDLLKPIIDKARKAVEDVGKEKGLIYIFDVSGELGTLLYHSNESVDVLPLAKTKLGIK